MAIRGVPLTQADRRALADLVERHGVAAVCEAANVRSAQSVYRALAGAGVLDMTRAALLAAGERLAASTRAARTEEPQ
jgi:hypothetical protein